VSSFAKPISKEIYFCNELVSVKRPKHANGLYVDRNVTDGKRPKKSEYFRPAIQRPSTLSAGRHLDGQPFFKTGRTFNTLTGIAAAVSVPMRDPACTTRIRNSLKKNKGCKVVLFDTTCPPFPLWSDQATMVSDNQWIALRPADIVYWQIEEGKYSPAATNQKRLQDFYLQQGVKRLSKAR